MKVRGGNETIQDCKEKVDNAKYGDDPIEINSDDVLKACAVGLHNIPLCSRVQSGGDQNLVSTNLDFNRGFRGPSILCSYVYKPRGRRILLVTGLPVRPVIKWAFGRRCQKVVSRGREDTRVWYRETMFSQMVSYEFLLHGALHGYFLYLVCAPPEKPTRRCEPEESYLPCSKRFDHGSHSIIFLLFEFKSVR